MNTEWDDYVRVHNGFLTMRIHLLSCDIKEILYSNPVSLSLSVVAPQFVLY